MVISVKGFTCSGGFPVLPVLADSPFWLIPRSGGFAIRQ